MKLKYIIYPLIVLGFGALIYYRISKTAQLEKSAPSIGSGSTVTQVSGVIARPSAFANSIAVSGSIEAEQQVQIISQVAGLVNNIYFKEGTNVKKGQLLFTIDDTELQAQLAQVLTQQDLAAETEKRAGLLLESGAISRADYDIAKAGLQSIQAQTQLIYAQIAKTKIRAPFNGKIGLSTLALGEYLVPAKIVANLVNIDPVRISFSVPEKYSGQVKLNTTLVFSVSGTEKKYSARVYAIEPGIQTTTRTLQLKARAANREGALIPGSFAQVELPISTTDSAILIPTEAIIPVQGGQKVFIVVNGKAKEVMVETATRTDKEIVITSGIAAGDSVVTTGNMALKAGSSVKVSINDPK